MKTSPERARTAGRHHGEAPYAWVIIGISAAMVGMAFGAIANIAVIVAVDLAAVRVRRL